ncbi:MAG TPA: hypothetical protein VFR32_04980 [Gaiellaceae bacterium]|nr:hypothetical protein [Gaiellaceae bacterium]
MDRKAYQYRLEPEDVSAAMRDGRTVGSAAMARSAGRSDRGALRRRREEPQYRLALRCRL